MGGIQFRKETRVSLEKERLRISLDKVLVEYEFLNQTNADITTEIAFPTADLNCFHGAGDPEFLEHGFQLWVDGAALKFNTETRAWVGKRDYTVLLRELGVDIVTCGHYRSENDKSEDLSKLSREDVRSLIALGLVTPDGERPLWTVRQIYYWTETFPAGRILHVKHEYKPGVGEGSQMALKYLDPFERRKDQVGIPELDNACLGSARAQRIMRSVGGPDFDEVLGYVIEWVDYILKTANNWQGPIKDFALEVDQPNDEKIWVNFCWKGPVERLGPNHIRVAARNFSPAQDLHILFLATASGR